MNKGIAIEANIQNGKLHLTFPIPHGAWEITGQLSQVLDAEVLHKHGERITVTCDGKIMAIDHKEKKKFR